jgi:hypothetical protein
VADSVRVVQVPLIHLISSGLQHFAARCLTRTHGSPSVLLIVCTADLIAALFTSTIGDRMLEKEWQTGISPGRVDFYCFVIAKIWKQKSVWLNSSNIKHQKIFIGLRVNFSFNVWCRGAFDFQVQCQIAFRSVKMSPWTLKILWFWRQNSKPKAN